jgi:hypothetical protein
MGRYIIISFAFIAWAFYEMSGGAEFAENRPVASEPQVAQQTEADEDTVTRGTLNLSSTQDVLEEDRTAPRVRTPLLHPREDTEQAPNESVQVSTLPSLLDGDQDLGLRVAPPITSEPEAETAQTEQGESSDDYRFVIGTRVNMRAGPGTGYDVIGQLVQGERVVVLEDPGTGWVLLDVDGAQGWMADFLLTTPP